MPKKRVNTFDIVYCVHALHHFDHPGAFVHSVRPLIRPGGALAIVGMDPHTGRDRWYLYDYFPGMREADLARYPSAGTIVDWMVAAGFDRIAWRQVARILDTQHGRDLLATPWLHKHSTSQLALLDGDAYTAGMAWIGAALDAAGAAGETEFPRGHLPLYGHRICWRGLGPWPPTPEPNHRKRSQDD